MAPAIPTFSQAEYAYRTADSTRLSTSRRPLPTIGWPSGHAVGIR